MEYEPKINSAITANCALRALYIWNMRLFISASGVTRK